MPNKSLEPTNLQLWQCKVGDNTLDLEQATARQLNESEYLRYQSSASINNRRQYLLSRALIRQALSELFSFPPSHWRLLENNHAPPTICNLPKQIFYSLSHSKGHICFVTAELAVGVDIEKIRPKDNLEQLAEVFMSTEELAHLSTLNTSHRLRYFYHIWCAKEAYYKAIELKHQQLMIFNALSIETELSRQNAWRLIDSSDQECYISIVINNKGRKIQLSNCTLFNL